MVCQLMQVRLLLAIFFLLRSPVFISVSRVDAVQVFTAMRAGTNVRRLSESAALDSAAGLTSLGS